MNEGMDYACGSHAGFIFYLVTNPRQDGLVFLVGE